MTQPNLIGSVFERKQTAARPTPPTAQEPQIGGFPKAEHRSKSAFARSREERRKNGSATLSSPPSVQPLQPPRKPPPDVDDWRLQMSRENRQRVESMTEEERQREREEIIERFGAGIQDLFKRVQDVRARKRGRATNEEVSSPPLGAQPSTVSGEPVTRPTTLEAVPIARRSSLVQKRREAFDKSNPPSALSRSSTRPPSRERRLRFAELAPEDVHVYESAPPSPRRKTLALPPPTNDSSAISLGQWKGTLKGSPQPSPPEKDGEMDVAQDEPEEGTAEYIRRRYFPDAPVNDPNLAWMTQTALEDTTSSSLRFDLNGKPIPPALSSKLPTHLGLHHHAEGSHAGYTLDDIFLLSRSTVPAQRATMLGVLARIAQRTARAKDGPIDDMFEFRGKEENLRKRILAAGVEAMSERGSVGARAIEVVWQCIVGWDEDLLDISGIELESESDAAIRSLPLEHFLPHITTAFAHGDLTPESASQLLDVLRRLARQNSSAASAITTTPRLVANVMQTFLLTPIPPTDTSPLPNPNAIDLLIVLASSSRTNALTLREFADALLRFVTFLPNESLYSRPLATLLLTSTLNFYTMLAKYGLYAHIASTAADQFAKLQKYIISECDSQTLMIAYLDLLEVWTTCAIDPHRTTPDHEILWSQIVGWDWHSDVRNLTDRLTTDEQDWEVWARVWNVNSAWLEGARLNGLRSGSDERWECTDCFQPGFEEGDEKLVLTKLLDMINGELSQLHCVPDKDRPSHYRTLGRYCSSLTAAIRLLLGCLPPLTGDPPSSPPLPLPFAKMSALCAKLTTHPLWSFVCKDAHSLVHSRPLSQLLSYYLRLSRRLPAVSEELWMAQALAILSRQLPGDEEYALQVLDEFLGFWTPGWTAARLIRVPDIIWEKGGMSIIRPFLSHSLRPDQELYIGPFTPTSDSILATTTQCLPAMTAIVTPGLPARRDWTTSAIDHLLRSGTSSVFKALPPSWDASEVEVTRASLLLTNFCRDVLRRFSLLDFVLIREEAAFACMKVFMLEHGQPHNDSSEEVFRDPVVHTLMSNLIRPYTIGSNPSPAADAPVVPLSASGNLEDVSAHFLGKTPFYQYYIDFVALYDAISFSDPLFAQLLLPPTSMRYAHDYRKHLWNDFGHVLRTVRTPVDQVISSDIMEYLSPVETDAQMIGAYLRELLKDELQGFVRLQALHHVASNIWPDLSDDSGWNSERASKLLATVATQGSVVTVRDLVRYRVATGQISADTHSPLDDGLKKARLDCVRRLGGEELALRLQGLFQE